MSKDCLFCPWSGHPTQWSIHLPDCPGVGGEGRPRIRSDRQLDELEEDAELATDGGSYLIPEVGDEVVDREQLDRERQVSPAIVVETHPTSTASEFQIRGLDVTVADANPKWDGGSPVVEVVFRDDLSEAELVYGGHDTPGAEECRHHGLDVYSYPAPRLARLGGST
jgi:hypothetical protein